MKRNYFGTDGIRGTVGQSPITPDFMLRYVLIFRDRRGRRKRLLRSGQDFKHALANLTNIVFALTQVRIFDLVELGRQGIDL